MGVNHLVAYFASSEICTLVSRGPFLLYWLLGNTLWCNKMGINQLTSNNLDILPNIMEYIFSY